jgi:hypothetical protein
MVQVLMNMLNGYNKQLMYFFAGNTWSKDGDVTAWHGTQDIWIVKIDRTGNIQ